MSFVSTQEVYVRDDDQTSIEFNAGDTVKWILPFLRAYGSDDESLEKFCKTDINLIPGASKTYEHINSFMPTHLVTTSYKPHAVAVSDQLFLWNRKHFASEVTLDGGIMPMREADQINEIAQEILKLPTLEFDYNITHFADYDETTCDTLEAMDVILNEKLYSIESARYLLTDAKICGGGGAGKAAALDEIKNIHSNLYYHDMMFVGDSITDMGAMQYLNQEGGVTVSFNGSRFAVFNAQIGVISPHVAVTGVLAEAFSNLGKGELMQLVNQWPIWRENNEVLTQAHKKGYIGTETARLAQPFFDENVPIVVKLTEENRSAYLESSLEMRAEVRKDMAELS